METIQGLILDQMGNPIPDATISMVQATAPVNDIGIMTNDQGRFFIDDLHPGRYTIRIFHGAGKVSDFTFSIPLADPVLIIKLAN